MSPRAFFGAFAAAFAAIAATPLHAAGIVTLETRPGITQSFLVIEPKRPIEGVVLLLPGHDGEVRFRETSPGGYEVDSHGGGLTAHRAMREALRRSGFAVAVVAPPSDRSLLTQSFRKSAEHLEDLRRVVAHLTERYGRKPYIQGHCLGTLSAASIASRLDPSEISGLILSSTRSTGADGSVTDFAPVKVPVLLVHHRDDSCPYSPYGDTERVKAFYRAAAPVVDVITVTGGDRKVKRKQESCQDGFHGFRGAQRETARAIAAWLRRESFPSMVEAESREP